MIRRVIHIADIHIRTFRQHEEYKEVFNALFSQLTELLIGFKRDEIRITLVGDLVHQKIVISNEQLMLGTWFLRKLEQIAPVIIIAGNHDLLENNKDRVDSITPMVQFLPDANINFFKESRCYLDDNIVWCVYSIFEGNKTPAIEAARAEFGPDKKYIGLFHAPVLNAKTDIGFSIDHGAGLEIFEGLDACMMGDIHMHQVFIHKDVPIIYPSSLIQQNFGESVSNHGFVVWNIEKLTYTHQQVDNRYPFYKVKINSLEDLEKGTEKFVNL